MGLEEKEILLSRTEYGNTGAETVHAIISNDWAKDEQGLPIFGKQYSYKMTGFQLHGPIPKDIRGGFESFQAAEEAARREYQDWRSGKVPPGTTVSRQEFWEMHYRQDRYLLHLTDDELAQRINDVMNNFMTLTEDEKIGFLSVEEQGDSWYASFAHLMEECRLRQTGVPVQRIKEWHHPNYDWPGVGNAAEAFKQMKLTPGEYLIKYSKLPFVEAALKRGEIRISPASSYDDPSLNYAIKDDELSLSLRPRPHSKGLPAPGTDREIITAPTNYYVYCMASTFSLRLFGDFEADACLVITNPQVFIERLVTAVLKQTPGWTGFGNGVEYVDPISASKNDVDIFRTKDFRYAYQQEYRLVWVPPSPQAKLPHIFVELGNLEDCCKLISLK